MNSKLSHWRGALKYILLVQNRCPGSVDVQVQKMLNSQGGFYLLQCINTEKHYIEINTLWGNKQKDSRLTDSQS